MDKLKFSRARESDLQEIMALIRQAVCNMQAQQIDQWDEIYPAVEDVLPDLRNRTLYTGKIDGRITVIFTCNDLCDKDYRNGRWSAHSTPFLTVHRLCVAPEYQNLGIGRKAMEYILEHLAGPEIKSVRLDSFSGNPWSLQLYKSLGFSIVGETHWRKGTFCLMEKMI
ncbi:MAG: GNAT family N-acetyltransferase [Eubacteriaceae bacterium]